MVGGSLPENASQVLQGSNASRQNARAVLRRMHIAEANQDAELSMNNVVCSPSLELFCRIQVGSGNVIACQVQGLLFQQSGTRLPLGSAIKATLRGVLIRGFAVYREARPNPSIEGTSTSKLRLLAAAPHVKR